MVFNGWVSWCWLICYNLLINGIYWVWFNRFICSQTASKTFARHHYLNGILLFFKSRWNNYQWSIHFLAGTSKYFGCFFVSTALQLGFWCFLVINVILHPEIHHHENPSFGRCFFELFPSIQQQIQVAKQSLESRGSNICEKTWEIMWMWTKMRGTAKNPENFIYSFPQNGMFPMFFTVFTGTLHRKVLDFVGLNWYFSMVSI